MSKIYEALLRAELDRAGGPQEVVGADEGAPSAVITAATPELFEEPQLDPPPTVMEIPIAQQKRQNAVPQMRRSAWTPDFDSLPALLSQGTLLEQFHNLRSHLYELRAQKPLKSILIGSGMPQEGKSFIAANLALTLAMHQNSSVLLIDGDLRRHSLHTMLGCPLAPGLGEYLSGQATPYDVMQQCGPLRDEPRGETNLQRSRLRALTFIASGSGVENAADLSANGRFRELIAAVSPQFDWIIVDSSPVNLVSDAINLAGACDGVLLVARANSTQMPMAQRTVSELKGANVLGFVLNGRTAPSVIASYYGYEQLEKQGT